LILLEKYLAFGMITILDFIGIFVPEVPEKFIRFGEKLGIPFHEVMVEFRDDVFG
jgi:hypothetical protein